MIGEYKRHAYARAILEDLQRYLRRQYISAEHDAPEMLLCEEVFYADRAIPQEAFLEMLERLQRIEQVERDHMQQYEMRRRPPPEPPGETPRDEPVRRPPRKRRPDADG